jgi:type II secretory pathway pseudopilin PulG
VAAGAVRRRSDLIILVAFVLVVGLANSLLGANSEHSFEARQARQQAAQQAQGRVLEQRLCTTLNRLAALNPPPGNPASNPSRAFEDELHQTLSQLGPDLGCHR